MQYNGKQLIQVDKEMLDGDVPCCRRYFYYSKHSLKCQLENSLSEDEDLHYAEANKLNGLHPTAK